MVNFNEYKEALDYIKRYFIQDLKELEIVSAQIFGSTTYEEGFVKGVSDIDICIFSPKMYTMEYQDIVDYISNNTEGDFIDKNPSVVVDYIADRIEFYINHPQIAIDITVMAPELPNSKNMAETVAHDSVDMFLGAFYQYGIPLIGEIPKKKLIEDEFFPFYDENLRKKRLDMLIPRIEIPDIGENILKYETIYSKITNSNPDVVYHKIFPSFIPNGAKSIEELCDNIYNACNKQNKYNLVSAYWNEPDHTIHHTGAYSNETKTILENIDKNIKN